jgi:hypothetical protein
MTEYMFEEIENMTGHTDAAHDWLDSKSSMVRLAIVDLDTSSFPHATKK